MNTNAWASLMYVCTDADAQLLLSTELRNLGRLVVQTEQNNGEFFVIVEADDGIAAVTVHELVVSIDPQAELAGAHNRSKSSRRFELVE